jgi:cation-transporting ATPase 13A3/4/5
MTSYSMLFNLYNTRTNIIKLRQMAVYTSQVSEYTSYDGLRQVNSTTIVPGSIIIVKEDQKMPCDCVLLEGECQMNEAILTGESVPVLKRAFEPSNLRTERSTMLYEGTTVLQVSKPETGVPCLVIRTGFSTLRGQLIRSILFPKPHKFKFFSESIHFLILLGVISLVGFACVLPHIVALVDFDALNIFYLLSNCITIAIPPSLPAAMSFGVSFAIDRLRRSQIFCISPPKVVASGRVDTICFDKTGTLTEETIVYRGMVLPF